MKGVPFVDIARLFVEAGVLFGAIRVVERVSRRWKRAIEIHEPVGGCWLTVTTPPLGWLEYRWRRSSLERWVRELQATYGTTERRVP